MIEEAVAEAEAFQLASAAGTGNGDRNAGNGAGSEEIRVAGAAETSGAADPATGLVYRTPQSMRKVLRVLP
jgi:hypothetical protein